MTLEESKNKIKVIFNLFKTEEIGNRLSQFALNSLFSEVMGIFEKIGELDGKPDETINR